MKSTPEEVDNILVKQTVAAANGNQKCIFLFYQTISMYCICASILQLSCTKA